MMKKNVNYLDAGRFPRVVIGHPYLARGGSEARVMWLIEALKHDHEVTVVTTGGWNREALNSYYGTRVREGEVKVRIAPVPWILQGVDASAIRGACFQRFAHEISKEYDVRISAYNPTDWGLPAVHFIADFTWQHQLCERLDPPTPGFFYKDTPIRRTYLRIAATLARPSGRNPLQSDHIVANSSWTARLLQRECGVLCTDIVYPPVWMKFPSIPWQAKEEGFVIIGRIVPEKQIEMCITILEEVRRRGHRVTLHICGKVERDSYGRHIKKLCSERTDWITLQGRVSGEKKAQILASCRYGIQCRGAEPFGIAVAEMIKAGAIVFAVNNGGQTEILDHPDILFASVDDAANKISAVLADPDAQSLLLTHLAARSKMFSEERFMETARAQICAPGAISKVISQSAQRLKIVIGHPLMGHGGSEAAVMWLIEALKRNHEVTVITTGGWDIDRLNSYYGTKVRENEVTVRIAPIPWFARRLSAAALRGACFQNFVRKIACEYDLRISAYNPTDWGLPAIHFIADFSWHPDLLKLLDPPNPGLIYRNSLIRRAYMKLAASYARPSQRDTLRDDRLIANSHWTKDLLRTICGAKCSDVIYPPVWAEFPQVPWNQKQDAFVMIGRIVPEKKIEFAIAVLDALRQAGFKIRFHLCGRIGKDRYSRRIARLCRERSDWVTVEGRVSGTKKADILSSCRFGIQARTAEPFGIAVAEMIKAGAIVFAPSDGGQMEILNTPLLLFSDRADAINKIRTVFQDPILQSDLRTHLAKQAGLFNPDTFMQAAGRCIPMSNGAAAQAIGSPEHVIHVEQHGTSLCEPLNHSTTALAR